MANKPTLIDILSAAKDYLNAGISVLPTNATKAPAGSNWKQLQKTRMAESSVYGYFSNENCTGIGLICGAVSNNLEVIDVDTKHDITGTLWADLYTMIADNMPDVVDSFTISKTISGGFHIYYRCAEVGRNMKLANRMPTDSELLSAGTEKVGNIVLIETRGEGGYVIAPPAYGYTYIQGDYSTIPTISIQQREILHTIARNFNSVETVGNTKDNAPQAVKQGANGTNSAAIYAGGNSVFENYNQHGDVISLLARHGWHVVGNSDSRIYLRRPGQTTAQNSGNWHTEKRVLVVHSTSTLFEPERGYSASQVYALLECDNDFKEAAKKLAAHGYGTATAQQKTPPERLAYLHTECIEFSFPYDEAIISELKKAKYKYNSELKTWQAKINIPNLLAAQRIATAYNFRQVSTKPAQKTAQPIAPATAKAPATAQTISFVHAAVKLCAVCVAVVPEMAVCCHVCGAGNNPALSIELPF
jgi:hypothetical protein